MERCGHHGDWPEASSSRRGHLLSSRPRDPDAVVSLTVSQTASCCQRAQAARFCTSLPGMLGLCCNTAGPRARRSWAP
eukprot:7516700-Pyramimonas_sp.AAC.1